MKPSDFAVKQTEGIRWLSFPPLDVFPFVLHGLMVKGRDSTADGGKKTPGKLLKTISRHDARPVSLSQMHRDECVTITSRDQVRRRYSGDAVLTNRADVLISVAVADCLPIFVVNSKRKVIGMIHAGWRGTLLGIARRTLEKAKDRFGCQPGDFTLLFGPCIQGCCYRVSDQVAILFDTQYVSRSPDGTPRLDLVRANLKQFTGSGVKKSKIFVVGECTFCEKELFFSYRRDKENAGRMIGFLGLK
ncbi:MAG: peptidoglycan editing factor PgeF [Candidatus Zixiibacteriota bacterium]|nr:MAG: peptidoglycan editing factor PgeF [candidate division Zixibacteria bacterium]